jgi:hypothetical protein
MKYLDSYAIFERKGDYQLFHKTNDSELIDILKDGYIISGGVEQDYFWDIAIRKNVIQNWKKDKFKTISATRNLDYFNLPALELDVEKISDRYKIIPYSENPDYYLDFDDNKLIKGSNKNIGGFQNMVRSKSKDAGKKYWKYKTDDNVFDHGIAEEIILTDNLDVSKYVKRIILDDYNQSIIKLVNKKYPNIEVIKVDYHRGYADIKKALKQSKSKNKKVFQEKFLNI